MTRICCVHQCCLPGTGLSGDLRSPDDECIGRIRWFCQGKATASNPRPPAVLVVGYTTPSEPACTARGQRRHRASAPDPNERRRAASNRTGRLVALPPESGARAGGAPPPCPHLVVLSPSADNLGGLLLGRRLLGVSALCLMDQLFLHLVFGTLLVWPSPPPCSAAGGASCWGCSASWQLFCCRQERSPAHGILLALSRLDRAPVAARLPCASARHAAAGGAARAAASWHAAGQNALRIDPA